MATAMKLSVPKPVNLPSMKKVRPRPDALTRNQRRSALFPVTNGGTRPRPEDDPRSRATVSTTAGALRERSQRAAGSERRPGGLDRQETRRRQGWDRATGADHRRGEASAPSRRRLVGVGRARREPGRTRRRYQRRPAGVTDSGPVHMPAGASQNLLLGTKPCPGSGAAKAGLAPLPDPRATGRRARWRRRGPGVVVRGRRRGLQRPLALGRGRARRRRPNRSGPIQPPRSPRACSRPRRVGPERGSYGHRGGGGGGRFPHPRGSGGSRDRPYYDEPNPFSDDDDDYDIPRRPEGRGGGGGGGGGGMGRWAATIAGTGTIAADTGTIAADTGTIAADTGTDRPAGTATTGGASAADSTAVAARFPRL